MLFISLIEFNGRIGKSDVEEIDRMFEKKDREDVRNPALYCTLGRTDAVRILKRLMKQLR